MMWPLPHLYGKFDDNKGDRWENRRRFEESYRTKNTDYLLQDYKLFNNVQKFLLGIKEKFPFRKIIQEKLKTLIADVCYQTNLVSTRSIREKLKSLIGDVEDHRFKNVEGDIIVYDEQIWSLEEKVREDRAYVMSILEDMQSRQQRLAEERFTRSVPVNTPKRNTFFSRLSVNISKR